MINDLKFNDTMLNALLFKINRICDTQKHSLPNPGHFFKIKANFSKNCADNVETTCQNFTALSFSRQKSNM